MAKLHLHISQRSPEWYAVRRGKFTASNAYKLCANSKGRMDYIRSVALEYAYPNQNFLREIPVTPAMQHGIDMEDIVRKRAEEMNGFVTQQVGFAEPDEDSELYGYVGCSPDGIAHDNLDSFPPMAIEIKCPMGRNFDLNWCSIPPKYKRQMCMNLIILGLESCLYIVHDANTDKIRIATYTPTKEERRYMYKNMINAIKDMKMLFEAWFFIAKISKN